MADLPKLESRWLSTKVEKIGGSGQEYSYTRYDDQSRIAEVGQVEEYILNTTDLNRTSFPEKANYTLAQQTNTQYDDTANNPDFVQENTRGRVATTSNENMTTFFSYDVHGNVKSLCRYVNGLGAFILEYDYDLISGNVKNVAYQRGQPDQYFHRYAYDADNRLTKVSTSEDGVLWDWDARLFYYTHGPLARMEVGQDHIQGMDYFYTLQGWIKGVNLPGSNSHTLEPGQDGDYLSASINKFFARDELAYTLGYHSQDYLAINSQKDFGTAFENVWTGLGNDILTKQNDAVGLFNGNIANMITDIKHLSRQDASNGIQAYAYQYDALHRIKEATDYKWNFGSWAKANIADKNSNTIYNYDANGVRQKVA